MPTNKNASFRYRVIDKCLKRFGSMWSFEELRKEISNELNDQFGIVKGISRRQLFYDLNIMKSEPPRGFEAPIVMEDGKYYYENHDYSITDHPLIDSDIEQLQDAILILKQFKGLPHFSGLEQIIQKLEGHLWTTEGHEVIQFEKNEDVEGLKWIEYLYKAIVNRKVLEIAYKSFKAEVPKTEFVHPYLLKEYRNRWFLLGYNESFAAISTYALDSIVKTSVTIKKYRINDVIDPNTYFKDIVGVSIYEGQEPEEIVFESCLEQAPYLKTKPIHQSQEILEENDNSTVFKIRVIPNFELEQLFLGYGERVKILKPEFFKNKILKRLQKAVESIHMFYIDSK